MPLCGVALGIRNIMYKARTGVGRGLPIASETGPNLKPRCQNGIKTHIHMDFEFLVNNLTKCSFHLQHA